MSDGVVDFDILYILLFRQKINRFFIFWRRMKADLSEEKGAGELLIHPKNQ